MWLEHLEVLKVMYAANILLGGFIRIRFDNNGLGPIVSRVLCILGFFRVYYIGKHVNVVLSCMNFFIFGT